MTGLGHTDELEPGSEVEDYRIEGVLGYGGMGVVYRTTDLRLDRPVALKLISSELSRNPSFRERFEREGKMQARLRHPHIVTVFRAGETSGRLFLAMELIEGEDLADVLEQGPLKPKRALSILRPVAEALDYAHGMDFVHRDLKPQNILLGAGDRAYLADFGLVKEPTSRALTRTGQFLGTIDYSSPEQIKGQALDRATDTYSLA